MTGVLYEDVNQNGLQESDEPGIAGATVTLSNQAREGALIRTAVTDENGVYILPNVPPGQYSLGVELPEPLSHIPVPVQSVRVEGSGPVSLPPLPIQTETRLYLPSVLTNLPSTQSEAVVETIPRLYLPAVQR